MRYLTLDEVLEIHRRVIEQSGGAGGVRDLGGVESAVALDGTLLGIMGYHKHWNVTPKNSPPRKKLAWAVPAQVIARLLEKAKG